MYKNANPSAVPVEGSWTGTCTVGTSEVWRAAYLVKVAKSHPLNCRCFPLGKRRHKLDSWWLLLQHTQGEGTENRITFINKGLAGGAGIHSYHFTSYRGLREKTGEEGGIDEGMNI